MKKYFLILMLLIGFAGSASSLLASCNTPYIFEYDGLCCSDLGGPAYWCTDGECWYCAIGCGPGEVPLCF